MTADQTKSPKHFHLSVLTLAVFLLVVALSRTEITEAVDYLYYDFLQRLFAQGADEDIVIVGVDDASLSALGRWPWSRRVHGDLIERLDSAKPKVIIYDIIFAEPNKADIEGDIHLAQAMKKNGRVVLPAFLDQHSSQGQLVEVLPHGRFADTAASIGHVHVELDFDGVVRHFYLREGMGEAKWRHITLEALTLAEQALPNIVGINEGSGENDNVIRYSVVRDGKKSIRFFAGPAEYTHVSLIDVLEGRIPTEFFQDKIVLVGATAIALGDQLVTPVSHSGLQLNGVELNANIYQNFRQNAFVHEVGKNLLLLVHLLIALFPIILLPRLSPNRSLFLIISSGISVLVASAVTFNVWSTWIPVSPGLIGLVVLYLLFTWRRLVMSITFLEAESERLEGQILDYQMSQSTPEIELESYEKQIRSDFSIPSGASVQTTDSSQNVSRVAPEQSQDQDPAIRKEVELFGKTISLIQQTSRDVESLRALFQSTLLLLSDAILVWNERGQVLFVNQSLLKACRVASEQDVYQLNALHILEHFTLLAPDTHWKDVISRCHFKRENFYGEIRNGVGKEFLLSLESKQVAEDVAPILIACMTEITDLKNAQRERNETIHFLSHDLRSPMVSMLALLEHAKHEQEWPADLLDRIAEYAKKNLDFAEKFLQLARLENQDDLKFELHDLGMIIDNAIEHLYWQAANKEISIHFNDHEISELHLVADLVERLFINILENAIKYCPKGSEIFIEIQRNENSLLCAISDNGPGIPESLLPNLFKRFMRAEQNPSVSGVGLGLRFTKVVMNRHGGEIRAFNNPEKGCTFQLQFPMKS